MPFGPIRDFWSGTNYVERVDASSNVIPRTMQISNVAYDTIMIFDGFSQSQTVGGASIGDYSQFHFGGVNASGDPSYFGARSMGIMSHNPSGNPQDVANGIGSSSVSIAYADGHADTVYLSTILGDTKYCVAGSPWIVGTVTSNLGRVGDLQIKWNNTDQPRGYWTATAGD